MKRTDLGKKNQKNSELIFDDDKKKLIDSSNEEERSWVFKNTNEAPNCEPGPSFRGLSLLE